MEQRVMESNEGFVKKVLGGGLVERGEGSDGGGDYNTVNGSGQRDGKQDTVSNTRPGARKSNNVIDLFQRLAEPRTGAKQGTGEYKQKNLRTAFG
jgi:hypothetical protein